jgi:hypothetical protein
LSNARRALATRAEPESLDRIAAELKSELQQRVGVTDPAIEDKPGAPFR